MPSTVSYKTEFEAAYIQDEELHAHRYRFEVTVCGPQRSEDHGFVIDYRTLGKYVNHISLQGCFLASESSENSSIAVIANLIEQTGVTVHWFVPKISIEMLCEYLATKLQQLLDRNEPGIRVIEAKLRETNDAFATYTP